jgi:hypothetical protein
MAYFDALRAQWTTLPAGDTPAQKLAAINALTLAGPAVDVPVGEVAGYLALQGKLSALQAYAASPPAGANATAVVAAKELVTLLGAPSVSVFRMSDAATATAVRNFLNALTADAATGITAQDVAALLGLAATTLPWWQASGYSSPIAQSDLDAAGGLS